MNDISFICHSTAGVVPGHNVPNSTTGRIQLRFDVEFKGGVSVAVGDVNNAADKFPAAFELVDDGSGKTILIGMLLPAVQKVR